MCFHASTVKNHFYKESGDIAIDKPEQHFRRLKLLCVFL